jgi:hypothetical protein
MDTTPVPNGIIEKVFEAATKDPEIAWIVEGSQNINAYIAIGCDFDTLIWTTVARASGPYSSYPAIIMSVDHSLPADCRASYQKIVGRFLL